MDKGFNATAIGMQRFTIPQLIDGVCNTLAPSGVCKGAKLQDIYNYKKIINNIAVQIEVAVRIELNHEGSDMCC